MKYLLQIVFLSLLLIPFMLYQLCISFWTFRTHNVKELWSDYKSSIDTNYRLAFVPKRRKPVRF
jgi:hypothetical protein